MKFYSFLIILLGVNLTGISIGIVIGYYINEYYWVYLSVPILTIGSLLMMYGTLNKENDN
jgi:uncharacterized Tic20 family protein|tara:strand:- start:194 stop:373 length:180 start_codon:yes stop_codon:yes gene_type:complete